MMFDDSIKINESKKRMKYTNFTISAIHILPACDDKLRNCLKEDWYFFNDRVELDLQ